MSKRFGPKRVPNCECTTRYTCGPCLRDAGPTLGGELTRAYYSRKQELAGVELIPCKLTDGREVQATSIGSVKPAWDDIEILGIV